MTPYLSPVDGKLVGLERSPLSEKAMRTVRAVYAARGHLPTNITPFYLLNFCADCNRAPIAWRYDEDGAQVHCRVCGQKMQLARGRLIQYACWWKPWTWFRPFIVDWKKSEAAEYETIARGTDTGTPEAGRLTLADSEERE